MSLDSSFSPSRQRVRYQYYYRQIWKFYQKPVTKVSLGLLMTIFTISFFAVFAIRPTLNTIGELLRKIDDQRSVLEQLKRKTASLNTAQNEYLQISDQLYLIDDALPENNELRSLMTMIEATASFHELAINSMRLGDPISYSNIDKKNPGIEEMSITLTINTSFNEIRPFIEDLSRIPRLVSVESIRFAQPRSADQNSGDEEISMSIVLRTYWGNPL